MLKALLPLLFFLIFQYHYMSDKLTLVFVVVAAVVVTQNIYV